MEVLLEKFAAYFLFALVSVIVLFFYFRKLKKQDKKTSQKITVGKQQGLNEPISLHPVISHDLCIGSGACIKACPEKDIIGITNNKAVLINASRCVGHAACFHACPVKAITLVMGTEKRGVHLPQVKTDFESSVHGIYIAGELGGMGLIKNATEQGKQAVFNLEKSLDKQDSESLQLIIIGAGPAGIAASLTAKHLNIRFLTIDQDTLGGTVASFPRQKLVMTRPMDLPLVGKVRFTETNKTELLAFWEKILNNNGITIQQSEKVESIQQSEKRFTVNTSKGSYTTQKVLLAIGRRGTPRKLGVPGENSEKVLYKLTEEKQFENKKVMVVGGGDSAIETALLLSKGSEVILSYRGESFGRVKEKNLQNITQASEQGNLTLLLKSNLKRINDTTVLLEQEQIEKEIENDFVFVMIGGELPTEFLGKAGIEMSILHGEKVLKH